MVDQETDHIQGRLEHAAIKNVPLDVNLSYDNEVLVSGASVQVKIERLRDRLLGYPTPTERKQIVFR